MAVIECSKIQFSSVSHQFQLTGFPAGFHLLAGELEDFGGGGVA